MLGIAIGTEISQVVEEEVIDILAETTLRMDLVEDIRMIEMEIWLAKEVVGTLTIVKETIMIDKELPTLIMVAEHPVRPRAVDGMMEILDAVKGIKEVLQEISRTTEIVEVAEDLALEVEVLSTIEKVGVSHHPQGMRGIGTTPKTIMVTIEIVIIEIEMAEMITSP